MGFDTVDLSGRSASAAMLLFRGAMDGGATSARGFENITGTRSADNLSGDQSANRIDGGCLARRPLPTPSVPARILRQYACLNAQPASAPAKNCGLPADGEVPLSP